MYYSLLLKIFRLCYRCGNAEELPLPGACADVITCAAAVQWVNYDKFNKEVDRVLKPGGCVALWNIDYSDYEIFDHPDKGIKDELRKAHFQVRIQRKMVSSSSSS